MGTVGSCIWRGCGGKIEGYLILKLDALKVKTIIEGEGGMLKYVILGGFELCHRHDINGYRTIYFNNNGRIIYE